MKIKVYCKKKAEKNSQAILLGELSIVMESLVHEDD
jgi:hypothetical protein